MRPPEFWNHYQGKKSAPALRTALKPLSWLTSYFSAQRMKNTDSYDAGVPVICIGNATMGGTGKTPVVIYLLKSLRRMGVGAVGLTRGYGGLEKGPVPVNARHNARAVGDEPLLLARHAPVWVSAGRDEGARAAVANGAKIIVMDDGHQNPQLKKTLSLLVVDAETGFGNGCVFPAGPLREPLNQALDRADAIILMKPDPEFDISDRLAEQLSGHIVIPAYLSPTDPLPEGPLYAFAGIGRPSKFFDSLRRHGGDVVGEVPYADHHKYDLKEIEALFAQAAEHDAQLITTEKDYVRLPGGYNQGVTAWPVSAVFEDELTLRRLLHPLIEQARRG